MKPFLQICLGISVVICSTALLINSASPAKADPNTQLKNSTVLETTTANRYEMTIFTPSGSTDPDVYILDRQTGKVNIYEETIQNKRLVWVVRSSIVSE